MINPRAVDDASGILNVCAVPLELIAKSFPVVPVANVWVEPVSAFKEEMPAAPALAPISTMLAVPLSFFA